jgi:DNA-binding NarL/FixJ family response regulator
VIGVLVADDQALLRGSFRLLIESEPGFEVVGEAADGVEAVERAHTLLPDVVLMDVRMPRMDGIAATRLICGSAATSGVRVLVLTMFDLDAHVFGALKAGASGFLLKDVPPAELIAGLRVVARGDALLAPGVTRRLIAEYTRRAGPGAPGAGAAGPGGTPVPAGDGALLAARVTEREREVLLLVARGHTNGEIGLRLHLSLPTVKTHVGRLLDKLGARDRTQLVILAYESGLVVPGTSW